MIRIWHQSFTDLTDMPLYGACLAAHADRVVGPDAAVVVHGLVPGTYGEGVAPIDAIRYRYLEALNEQQICEAALAAEREGFDGFAIGCFFDPALRATRSLVDIPVVSLAESCLLTACQLGRAAGVVTLCPEESDNVLDLALSYGLASRTAGVVGLQPAIDEFTLELESDGRGQILERFEAASASLIARGADVIVPGDGVLNEFLVRAGCTAVLGIPVLDSIAVLWSQAVMMAKLRSTTNLTVSRRHIYAKPTATMLAKARAFAGRTDLGSEGFSTYSSHSGGCTEGAVLGTDKTEVGT